MDSPKTKELLLPKAYREVWLTTAYSRLTMLNEILTVNKRTITQFLEIGKAATEGKKIRQLGLKEIPEEYEAIENTYSRKLGLCTAFTIRRHHRHSPPESLSTSSNYAVVIHILRLASFITNSFFFGGESITADL